MSQDNKSFIITLFLIILAISTTLYFSFQHHETYENRVIFQNTELIRFQKDIQRHDIWLTEHEIKIHKLKTKLYKDMKAFDEVIGAFREEMGK